MKRLFFVIITSILLFSHPLDGQQTDPAFLNYINHPWVDSVMNTLSLDEKIAQTIWIAAYSNKGPDHEMKMAENIKKYGVGGLLFFQGTAEKQIELINYYQSISKVPLIFTIDAEWGVGMRLSDVINMPYQMTLGAISNDSLIYRMGQVIADQCKAIGVQFNFAPVADINNNPSNPVINYRSFGENRENTAKKAAMYAKGMQSHGVLASAKHFPGHGDTNTDSHLDLPVIRHSKERLDSLELYPFKYLIKEGVGAIMTAHLNLPSLDSTTGLPSTLSKPIISGLLKNELGFKGIIVTDAMNMQGVTKYFKKGEAEARALLAGNDVVEYDTDVEGTIRETKKLIENNELTIEDIDAKCRKILALKYWSGLASFKPLDKTDATNRINNNNTKALINELYANALTVLNNDNKIIPIRNNSKVAVVSVNKNRTGVFDKRLGDYMHVDSYSVNTSSSESINALLDALAKNRYDVVIAGVFGLDQRPEKNYNINNQLIDFLNRLIKNNNTIVTWYGNPYSINKVNVLEEAEGLILAYQDNVYVEDMAAQLIFGAIGAKGSLPVTINNKYPYGYGIITPGNLRVRYGYPENVGVNSKSLEARIDSLVNLGLTKKAFPGCEVMIAKDGTVIFNKTYGYHEYDDRIAVKEDDLYDLASVTKVTSTLPCLMKLDSENLFSLDKKVGDYVLYFDGSDVGDLYMKDLLTHQAGLAAWIPFWQSTVNKKGELKKSVFRTERQGTFSIPVAENLYMNKKHIRKMFKQIKQTELTEHGKYVYSDLGLILSKYAVEDITGENIEKYVDSVIYKPLGINDIVFNPLNKYPLNRIVPTEMDNDFRKQQIHGTVHDETAAMFGGIAGHAGLFSTANDLMKLMEMYRRMGSYGGEQIIDADVMKRYTTTQFPENGNRRALGFDKPLLDNASYPKESAYPCQAVSQESFGHSGFTGTFVWVDPTYGISYVFLCNRVYPTRDNNLLSQLNIRTEILQSVYESMIDKKENLLF